MSSTGGLTLKQYIPEGGLELAHFLGFAKQLIDELARLHFENIIHKRVNAYHITVSVDGDQVQRLCLEAPPSQKPTEGALLSDLSDPGFVRHLPYMSPEQTGRINQFVDKRSDLYSLGVVLFEMAAGALPFLEKDPMQLMHGHIAKVPPKLVEIKSAWPTVISTVISNMIDRLLAKSADNRYKSCHGLYKDLEQCIALLNSNQPIAFQVGMHDDFERFHISNKLYGRAADIKKIEKKYRLAAEESKQVVERSRYAAESSAIAHRLRQYFLLCSHS